MTEREISLDRDQMRVFVLAPAGRDAAVTANVLSEEGLSPGVCASIEELCEHIAKGAGAAVIAEEALGPAALKLLMRYLRKQPPWSDFPLILLIGGRSRAAIPRILEAVGTAGSITLLERPMMREALVSAVRVALRARLRQYEIRDHLRERERAAAALRASEERFRVALANSPIRVAHVDRELRYTWMYNAHPDVEVERALGKRLDDILPPDDISELMGLCAEVLTTGRSVRREISITFPSGRAVWDVAAEPLRDSAGQIVGVTTAAADLTERKRLEAERARLAAIVETSSDAIVSRALDGTITSWNAAAERTFGYTATEAIGRDIAMLVPPDRLDEFARIRQDVEAGVAVAPFETVRLTKDGRRLDVSIAVSPLLNADGVVVGTSIITRDISERRQAQERQKLLLAELSHRVKNTLATVLSIANQTLARAKSVDEFARSFRGRIQALAAAHSLLTAVNWDVAALRVLVEQALRPYASSDRSNLRISGDEVLLRPSAALTFSLVLHELATNAAKHGALQKPGGLVAVDCRIQSESGRELHLHWAESGGPPVRPPVRRGFGLELIERSVAHELGGQAVLHYPIEGVFCDITVPLADSVGTWVSAAQRSA
jgi:two-component system, chemotaxis family, CheB/CheR fusion protein